MGGSPSALVSPLATEITAALRCSPACDSASTASSMHRDGTARKTWSARATPSDTGSIFNPAGSSIPGRYRELERSPCNVCACSWVRVCRVVRRPERVRITARAVPKEPAPITVARLEPPTVRPRPRARPDLVSSDSPWTAAPDSASMATSAAAAACPTAAAASAVLTLPFGDAGGSLAVGSDPVIQGRA